MSQSPECGFYDFSVVRSLRKREGLTLAQLAASSGVSPAVLSKLERNQTAAELDTIARVARAFGLSASDLIGLAESSISHRKAADSYAAGDFSFHRIRYSNHSCYVAEAGQGAKLNRPEAHGDELETCWVLQGKLRLTVSDQPIDLRPGESVQFDAVQNHTYEVLEDAVFMIVHIRKPNRF